MPIGALGINHKNAHLEMREKMAQACQRLFSLSSPMPCVLLLTCNRCEIYFSYEDAAAAHSMILSLLRQEGCEELTQKWYSYFEKDAFLHLAQVCCGFDSAIFLETEIQGQVRAAYCHAQELGKLSRELHILFQKCLQIGKSVRERWPTLKANPELEEMIFSLAKDHFGEKLPAPLFVGCSEINCKIAHYLRRKGIEKLAFCNRTSEKSHLFSTQFSASVLPWNKLQGHIKYYSWVIAATKSPYILIDQDCFPREHSCLFFDLSVPRNVSTGCPGKLYNIDEVCACIEKKKSEKLLLAKSAKRHIEEMVEFHYGRLTLRSSSMLQVQEC
jgi:glutamyl-tRNA reductase